MANSTTPTDTQHSGSPVYRANPNLIYYMSTIPRFSLEISGIISNIINFVVLTNRRMRGCFNTLLIGLTCADFFSSVSSLPFDIWGITNPQNPHKNWPFPLEVYIYFILYTLGNTCFGASSMITCSIMVFRFIAVKFPLKSNIYITHKRVTIAIVSAFLLSFALVLKCFAQFTIVDKIVNNETIKDVTLSKYATPTFTQVTDNLQITMAGYLPFSICVIFAVLTLVTIRTGTTSELTKTQSEAEKQRRIKESRVTRTLLIVVFFYLITSFFSGLRYSLRAKLGWARYQSYGVSMTVFDCLARNALLFNSSVNLILYSATNASFRETFWELFCGKHKSTKNLTNNSITVSETLESNYT